MRFISIILAALVLVSCADTDSTGLTAAQKQQVQQNVAGARKLAASCPPDVANRIRSESETIESALSFGLPPTDPLNALTEQLHQCSASKAAGYRTPPQPRPVSVATSAVKPGPHACTQAELDVLDANRMQDEVDPLGTDILRAALTREEQACAY